MTTLLIKQYSRYSLAAILLTGLVTTLHHVYRLGLGAVLPFIILTMLMPYLLMYWYRRTSSLIAISLYGLLNFLIFLWFGFIDGFLDHVFKALGLENVTFLAGGEAEVVETAFSLGSPELGNFFYEGTGVLTSIISLFVLYYGYQLIRAALMTPKQAAILQH